MQKKQQNKTNNNGIESLLYKVNKSISLWKMGIYLT